MNVMSSVVQRVFPPTVVVGAVASVAYWAHIEFSDPMATIACLTAGFTALLQAIGLADNVLTLRRTLNGRAGEYAAYELDLSKLSKVKRLKIGMLKEQVLGYDRLKAYHLCEARDKDIHEFYHSIKTQLTLQTTIGAIAMAGAIAIAYVTHNLTVEDPANAKLRYFLSVLVAVVTLVPFAAVILSILTSYLSIRKSVADATYNFAPGQDASSASSMREPADDVSKIA